MEESSKGGSPPGPADEVKNSWRSGRSDRSSYILESGNKRIMIDCGLFQGKSEDKNSDPPDFDPSTIDVILLTHAHLDHTGRVPLLVKMGFSGQVIATAPTVELTDVLWKDSSKIQKEDAEWKTRKNRRKGLPPEEPLYSDEDVEKAIGMLVPVTYDEVIEVVPGIKVSFATPAHFGKRQSGSMGLFRG